MENWFPPATEAIARTAIEQLLQDTAGLTGLDQIRGRVTRSANQVIILVGTGYNPADGFRDPRDLIRNRSVISPAAARRPPQARVATSRPSPTGSSRGVNSSICVTASRASRTRS